MTYDPDDNSRRSYNEAIKAIRLQGIREGKYEPRKGNSEEIEAARTGNGGWTKEQLAAWGVPWPPPKGWKKALENEAAE